MNPLRIGDLGEVVPRNLKFAGEGIALVEQLVAVADKVDPALWLEWLTVERQLLRLARLAPDEAWIAELPVTTGQRMEMYRQTVLPVCDVNGVWIVASLRGDGPWREDWSQRFDREIFLAAPTLTELASLMTIYRYDAKGSC